MRRWICSIAALLLAMALTTQPAHATAGRMQYAPTGDYTGRISAALAAVRDAQHHSGATRAHKLAAARALLPPHVSVQLGGVQVHADLGAVRPLTFSVVLCRSKSVRPQEGQAT